MDEGIWGDVDVGPAWEAGNCRGELVFVFIGTSSITSLVSIFFFRLSLFGASVYIYSVFSIGS
jgi:hypothetical protein